MINNRFEKNIKQLQPTEEKEDKFLLQLKEKIFFTFHQILEVKQLSQNASIFLISVSFF